MPGYFQVRFGNVLQSNSVDGIDGKDANGGDAGSALTNCRAIPVPEGQTDLAGFDGFQRFLLEYHRLQSVSRFVGIGKEYTSDPWMDYKCSLRNRPVWL